jgi:hypothetical protein
MGLLDELKHQDAGPEAAMTTPDDAGKGLMYNIKSLLKR